MYLHKPAEQNAPCAYLFSAICHGNCRRMRFAALLGETLESTQFPMTQKKAREQRHAVTHLFLCWFLYDPSFM